MRYFNIDFEFDRERVFSRIDECLKLGGAAYICVADGNILQMVHRDMAYRETVGGAMFSICDSSWTPLLIERIHGFRPPQYCGSRIFEDLTAMKKYSQCYVGTSRPVLDSLKLRMSETDPAISSMPFLDLPFANVEDFDYAGIAAEINDASPDIIWVALGAPKQERFMERLRPYLRRGVMIGVGAVFNFYSGAGEPRAPQWMVDHHLEFVYRIMRSPRKQLKRCLNILKSYPSIYHEEKRRKGNE